ncbi:MAG: dTDP-4-dehydrorhamnose reductase [Candidatus Aenigmarchaeota archaeon]|nr:dTDP-4-dehydrorhamnose reductase [Candidatus Aenigmarchaeota archaeon]
MKGKVLVTGVGGQIGTDIVEAAADWEVVATGHRPGRAALTLDVADRSAVRDTVRKARPDVVVHAASMTNVDQCEKDRQLAYRVNVEGTRNIADACKEADARLAYLSTDFVFDGRKGGYQETDLPQPVNYYGETKLLGEQAASGGLIARTSVVYSPHRETFNFVRWVITELSAGRQIRVVTDQFGSPSLSSNVAAAVMELCAKGVTGLFHVAGTERMSRFDFARLTAEAFGLDAGLITPITTAELHQAAVRPRDSSLDVRKASALLKTKLLGPREGLRRIHV